MAVIIPTRNEERNIPKVFRELNDMGFNDILVIDGNSVDRTVEIAKELGANVIPQEGRGKGSALRQAFRNNGFDSDVIVFMDADGSMSPKEIPLFVEALNSGADLVKGSRFLPYGYTEDMSLLRKIGNRFFVLLVNLFWSAGYTDLCYGYGAFKKDALEKLSKHLKATNFDIEAEMFIKAKKIGLIVEEVPSMEFRRGHGKSSLCTFKDGFSILKMIVGELLGHANNR